MQDSSDDNSILPVDTEKLAALNTGQVKGLNRRELDLKSMSPVAYQMKYGSRAKDNLQDLQSDSRLTSDLLTADKSAVDSVRDGSLGVAQGAVNSIGGVAALGAKFNPASYLRDFLLPDEYNYMQDTPQKISELTESVSETIGKGKTDVAKSRAEILEQRQESDELLNRAIKTKEIESGVNPNTAALREIGRGAIDSFDNIANTPGATRDIVSQGVGSLAVPIAGTSLVRAGLRPMTSGLLKKSAKVSDDVLSAAATKATERAAVKSSREASETLSKKIAKDEARVATGKKPTISKTSAKELNKQKKKTYKAGQKARDSKLEKAVDSRIKAAERAGMKGEARKLKALRSVHRNGPWYTSMVGTESGSSYVETANRVIQQDYESLSKLDNNFDKYVQEFKEEGLSDERAKERARYKLADDAGSSTALKVAGVSAALAPLTKGIEKPFRATKVRSKASSIAGEGVEETGQGSSQAYLSNVAYKDYVDPDTDTVAGVGRGATEGFIGGLSAAGIVSGPSLAGSVVGKGSGAVTGFVGDTLKDRAERIRKDADAASPLSTESVSAVETALQENSENIQKSFDQHIDESDVSDEEKAIAKDYVSNLIEASKDIPKIPDEMRDQLPAELVEGLESSTTRVEAAQKLADSFDKQDGESAATYSAVLGDLLFPIAEQEGVSPKALESIPKDSELGEVLESFGSVPKLVRESKAATELYDALKKGFQSGYEERMAAGESLETDGDPGQLSLLDTKATIAEALISPETVDPNKAEIILKHSTQKGGTTLSVGQRGALLGAIAVAKGRVEALNSDVLSTEDSNIVTEDILSSEIDDPKAKKNKRSIASYVGLINKSLASGDTETAEVAKNVMGDFVQHLNNKAEALIKSKKLHSQGKRGSELEMTYMAKKPTGEGFINSSEISDSHRRKYVYWDPDSDTSNAQALKMLEEARIATNVFEMVSEATPELKLEKSVKSQKIEPQELPTEKRSDAYLSDDTGETSPVEEAPTEAPDFTETVTELKEDQSVVESDGTLYARSQAASDKLKLNRPVSIRSVEGDLIPVINTKLTNTGYKISKYLRGVGDSPKAKQTANVMQFVSEKLGKTPQQIVSAIGSTEGLNEVQSMRKFLGKLENNRIKTVRGESYPRTEDGRPDFNSAEAIELEAQTFIDTMASEHRSNLESMTDSAIVKTDLETETGAPQSQGTNLKGTLDEYIEYNSEGELVIKGAVNVDEILPENNGKRELNLSNELLSEMTEMGWPIDRITESLKDSEGAVKFAVLRELLLRDYDGPREENLSRASVEALETVTRQSEPVTEKSPETAEEMYPDLYISSDSQKLFRSNGLYTAFKPRPGSLVNEALRKSPLTNVSGSLRNPAKFNESNPQDIAEGEMTPELSNEYGKILNLANEIRKSLQKRLTEKLNKVAMNGKNGKKSTTFAEELESGNYPLHAGIRAKMFNLLDSTGEQYDKSLSELAILAGLQTVLSVEDSSSPMYSEQITKEFGITEDDVSASEWEVMVNGLDRQSLVDKMATKTLKFWGLAPDSSAAIGYTQGIPKDVSAKIFRELEALGVIKSHRIIPTANSKPFVRYTINSDSLGDVGAFPNAIENLVLGDLSYEDKIFLGDKNPPLPETFGNNKNVPTTPEQKEAAKNQSSQRNYVDNEMMSVISSLGSKGVQLLFGGGVVPKKGHTKVIDTIESQNMSVGGAANSIIRIWERVQNEANRLGVSPESLGIRYGISFASNGRQMFKGAYNPQAHTVSRHVFLPTNSSLDLVNNQDHQNAFKLSMAQSFDLKLDKENIASIEDQLSEKLNQEGVKSVLEDFRGRQKTGNWEFTNEQAIELRSALEASGVQMSGPTAEGVRVVHALKEYARFQNASEADKGAFETTLYIEADGVSNGPANAISFLQAGGFTPQQLRNRMRTGIYFGPAKTADELYREVGEQDVYGHTAMNTAVRIKDRIKKGLENAYDKFKEKNSSTANKKQAYLEGRVKSVMYLLTSTVKGLEAGNTADSNDISEIISSISRSFAKNPITIKNYGSSEYGIADNIANEVANSYYRLLHEFANNPNDQALKKRLGAITSFLETAVNWKIGYVGRSESLFNYPAFNESGKNFKGPKTLEEVSNLVLTGDQMASLTNNINTLLVDPLSSVIDSEEGLGASLPSVNDHIVQATSLPSILASKMFDKLYKEKVERKIKESLRGLHESTDSIEYKRDARVIRNLGLSEDEIAELNQEMDRFVPTIEVDGQKVRLGTQEFTDAANDVGAPSYDREAKSGETMRPVKGSITKPTDIGVGGIPGMVIAFGDALMMLKATSSNKLKNFIQIFDGGHMPLDQVNEQGQVYNEAAHGVLQVKPYRQLSEFLKTFTEKEGDLLDDSIQEELNRIKNYADKVNEEDDFKRLRKTMNVLGESVPLVKQLMRTGTIPPDIILYTPENFNANAYLAKLSIDMETEADQIDARHQAEKELDEPMTVDQMAGPRTPHTTGESPTGVSETPESLSDRLNKIYNKILGNEPIEKTKKRVKKLTLRTALPSIPATGEIVEVQWDKLSSRLQKMKLTQDQRHVFNWIKNNDQAKNARIFVGDSDSLTNMAKELNFDVDQIQEQDHGLTLMNADGDTVILLNTDLGVPTTETIVHELIHATTSRMIDSYYRGEQLDPDPRVNAELEATVSRLDILREEFGQQAKNIVGNESVDNLLNEFHKIEQGMPEEELSQAQKSARLSEFVAWSLSNPDLAKELRTQEVKNPQLRAIAKIAKKAYAAVRKLILKSSRLPVTAGKTNILDQVKFNTNILIKHNGEAETSREMVNYHSTNPSEEIDVKLRAFSEAYANETLENKELELEAKQNLNAYSDLANEVGTMFGMSSKNHSRFMRAMAIFMSSRLANPSILVDFEGFVTELQEQLTVDDFMDLASNSRDMAIQQYNFVMGSTYHTSDSGVSTLLPSIIALGLSSPKFREMIKSKDIKSKKYDFNGVDNTFTSIGQGVMDLTSQAVMGKPQTEFLAEFDRLVGLATETEFRKKNVAEVMSETNQGLMDKADNALKRAIAATAKRGQKSSNKGVQFISDGIADMFSEDAGAGFKSSISDLINQGKVHEFVRSMVSNIVGRTDGNKDVLDMVKKFNFLADRTRNIYRKQVPDKLRNMFINGLDEGDSEGLRQGIALTDLSSLKRSMSTKAIARMMQDQRALSDFQIEVEENIKNLDPVRFRKIFQKADELAEYMKTGKVEHVNLLRNSKAISHLFNEAQQELDSQKIPKGLEKEIDQLVTLYGLQKMSSQGWSTMTKQFQRNPDAMEAMIDYHDAQRREERTKARAHGLQNSAPKGYIPRQQKIGETMIVAPDAEAADLALKGYKRVAAYGGSNMGLRNHSYYFLNGKDRAAFGQGLVQTVNFTAGGLDAINNSSNNMVPIVDSNITSKSYSMDPNRDKGGKQKLIPIYDSQGRLEGLEPSLDIDLVNHHVTFSEDFFDMMGEWRSRQVMEEIGKELNYELIHNLNQAYEEDYGRKDQYVNVMDPEQLTNVQARAMSIMPGYMKQMTRTKDDGNVLMVKRELVEDVLGRREASVRDFFTDSNNLDPTTNRKMQDILIGTFGKNAFKTLSKGEDVIQGLTANARNTIVIRSMKVVFSNFGSNMIQLMMSGIPLSTIATTLPKKLKEVRYYHEKEHELIEIETRLRQSSLPEGTINKLSSQRKRIQDSFERLSIWPLIENGELSTLADVGATEEDLQLTRGNLLGWIDSQVDRLPPAGKEAAQTLFVSPHSSFHKGLEKATLYGDFLAKAIMYEEMTTKEGMNKKEALGRITEEFVNYDRLEHRGLSYAQNMGLIWFAPYKLRSLKIAARLISEHPFRTLVHSFLPYPNVVGSPISDNVVGSAMKGSLGYSIGPAMGINAWQHNTWYSLMTSL